MLLSPKASSLIISPKASSRVGQRRIERITHRICDDATYEGDLYAAAGAKFRLGRESRQKFGEEHAGVVVD